MADPKLIIDSRSSSLNIQTDKTSSPKKPSQQVVNHFHTQSLLNKNKSMSSARDTIANRISEDTHQIDKSKYNDVLRDYNTQAAQNNCKGQCHGYEAGFEEEKEFNSRMQEMHKRGYAPKGHALTYRETNWWWKFGNGDSIKVDGNVLKPLEVPGRIIASPFPRLDDLKVHGSISLNQKNEINKGLYDFNSQNVRWYDAVGHIRNYLNNQAITEHGEGQESMINYDYRNSGKVK